MSQQHPTRSPGPEGPSHGPAQLLAYVDESMPFHVDGKTGYYYYLAAAVIADHRCEEVRSALRPLPQRALGRIHWRQENPRDKELIIKTISGAQVESVIVVGTMSDPRNQERARQQVMKQMLWQLDQRAVSEVTLESRGTNRDAFDLRSIGQFRQAQIVSRRLTVGHARALQEPLLWVPDAVAGAAGDLRCDRDQQAQELYTMLEPLVEHFDLGTI